MIIDGAWQQILRSTHWLIHIQNKLVYQEHPEAKSDYLDGAYTLDEFIDVLKEL